MRVTIAYNAISDIISSDIIDYSITIDSTPLNSNDSSGSVGDFSVSFLRPLDPENHINTRGIEILEGKSVQFNSDYGTIHGTIQKVRLTDNHRVDVECVSYAGGLNAYNVRAEPVGPWSPEYPEIGTLRSVLLYYFSLGKHNVNLYVDPEIADRYVTYPGWSGELWYHLKLLCAAEDIQFRITGEAGVEVEPVRQESISARRFTSISTSVDSSNLAQFVEVREYNCESKMSVYHPFYPPGGWSEDVEILQVNAGEYTEQVIEVGGSILSVTPEPQMKTFISKDDQSPGYTVIAEDGFPVQLQQWEDRGGLISFEVGEDFRTVIVKMKGATEIRLVNGDPATSFALALSADSGGSSRYSTLRISGQGVIHDTEKTLRVATGIPPAETGTEVGTQIDNPFLFDRDRVGKAASRAVQDYSGALLKAEGEATSLTGGFGVGDAGTRVVVSGRPFRIRGISYTPGGVSVRADDDLTHQDVQDALAGKTYGDIDEDNSGLTYRNVVGRGIR